ncbi:MAG: CsgG/HfaB family protein [Spirochaetaceae bacterium]|jgi:hypothetical protein|nr:CsgG/HfaB family protein [Spirochaetaceae bacterium]
MNKTVYAALFAALLFAGFTAGICAQSGGTVEITVQRADGRINQGFRERIYIDGKAQLNLANGASGKIAVSRGEHTIHAELYTLTTPRLQFTAGSSPLAFVVTPYSTNNFVIERAGGRQSPPVAALPEAAAAATENVPQVFDPSDTSIEAALSRAASTIMSRVPPRSKMAIVYVTARDAEVSEFIAGELEFIMVGRGLTLIDRSELDRIRREQAFQMSGEVDDTQAVSIGKIAGADVIITGSATGSGELRRLRLRALNTETGQVLAVASERY